MLKNKILDRKQDLTISSEDSECEKSNIEIVRDIFCHNTVPSEGKKNTKYLDQVIKIENMDDTETSSENKYESYHSCVKGIKRKADTCSIVSVKIKQKLSNNEQTNQLSKNSTAGMIESLVSVKIKKHNISTSEQHIQPAKNLTAEPLQLKKAVCNNVKESKSEEKFNCRLSDSRKNFCKQVSQTEQSVQTLENETAEPLKMKKAVWNNDKKSKSEETFDCCLPGCRKQFRKQKIYETHIKHFHGIFNFEKSEPIITALFYACGKKGNDKLACKKKVKEKSAKLEDVETENSDIRSTLLPFSSFDYKLPSKFSDSEILLPNSLIRSIELISAGKMITEVIYEDSYKEKKLPLKFLDKDFYPIKSVSLNKRGLNLENDNKNISGICKKINSSSRFNFQKFSSVKSDIKLLGDNRTQHSSNNASVQVPVLSNTGDSLISTITQENKSLEDNEKSISDIKNSIQEDHLYASKKLDGEYINQKIDVYKNNSVVYSHYKLNDKIKNPSIDTNKFGADSDIYCGNTNTPVVSSYEEFVKKKERECLDLDSSLSNKFSILEVINQKGNANNQDKISTAVSLILHNMTHNPSFGLMPNLNSKVSQNTQIASRNVDLIRRFFELCNCARNLKEILFKCKQILHRLSEYAVSEDKNISLLPCTPVDTDKCDKLLHYIFFLDVIRDPSFTSIYVQHILRKPDLAVLNKLTDPVSLYLTNTEKELPNVKLRRDREFLQRNSDFFKVLLKIQKSCHILPYANSSISAEELCRPTTNLRLEKSDFFTQVFCHVKSEKDPIFLQSYGVNKDLSVSPFVECVCDDYYVHKLAGFVLLPRPDSFVTKDMCVGLCFESTAFSFRHLVIQLSLIADEIKKIISEIREELSKESTQHCSSDMTNNLLIIFNLIDTETDCVFSALDLFNNFVNKLPTLDNKGFLGEIKIELIKYSIKEIINIIEKLKDLKECDTIS